MNELNKFFNTPGGSKPVKLRGPMTCGIRVTTEDATNPYNRREEHKSLSTDLIGTEYSLAERAKEWETYKTLERDRPMLGQHISGIGAESMEQLSLTTGSVLDEKELTLQAMTEVYSKYSFKKETTNIEINPFKDKIMQNITSQPVTIIEGPTGCGKTTQVPQWILDHCYDRRVPCKIVVTQPRRIAAISIAKRVAQERGWEVGGLVGYQVGLDNQTTSDTCIQYVTTGVLLQKLVNSKSLLEYTHVILDEVHERGQEMDFLLLVVKKLLFMAPTVPFKLILMSATFNVLSFSNYFSVPCNDDLETPATISITKSKPKFRVKINYLDDLLKFDGNQKETNREPGISTEFYDIVIKLLNVFETIDEQEQNFEDRDKADIPSVLIFLPGINEIEDLYGLLSDLKYRAKVVDATCAKFKWWVLPLHSTITSEEQIRVFQRAPHGHRKVILSTNIAESSITVPDIKYVIDFCLMKVLVADESTNFTSLQLMWASKTNCVQRAGRAGRVRDGRVYRLVKKKFYEEEMEEECKPEMQRCPLERLVLLAKMLDMGAPVQMLALAMNPPDLSNIHRTVLALKEIGCLKKTLDGEASLLDGDITYLGRICAKLPLTVTVTKLIVLGHIYGCLEECIIMAAAMSVKNMFSSPFLERLNSYNSRLTWADGSTSDSIAFMHVYKVWNHLRQQDYFRREGKTEFQWTRLFYVQLRSLKEMDDLVRELKKRLAKEGIESDKKKSQWDKSETQLVLKILLAGAFYPNYFIQAVGDENRERDAVKMLSGADPRNTVYLKGFPPNQPGPLYAGTIKNHVKRLIGIDPIVTFDGNSSKVFLSFEDNGWQARREALEKGNPIIPGKVLLPVYKAVKARQLNIDFRVALLPSNEAYGLAAALESVSLEDSEKLVPKLPEIDETYIPIKISQFVNCGRFWAQLDDESTESHLAQILARLNTQPLAAVGADATAVRAGDRYAAPYQEGAGLVQMYRVRVHKVLPKNMLSLVYIDYGSYGQVNVGSLRMLPKGLCSELQPLAMECVLAEVTPTLALSSHGEWTKGATRFFQETISRGRLIGQVYSVCRGVVSIELLLANGTISVNKELIKHGFAQPTEESYESKLNHDLRVSAAELNMAQKRAHNRVQTERAVGALLRHELEPPPAKDCAHSVQLKGPHSPLESSLHSVMYGSKNCEVIIEWNSVNSVLIDTEPQQLYERLLVAAHVGQNQSGSKLTLRDTTLMPSIPGLPAILAILFCPSMELRRDHSNMRYVSALCGLGAYENGRPLFPEHDMLINIDVDLNTEDLGLINHIRHMMDYTMYCHEGEDVPDVEDPARKTTPASIRKILSKLVWRRRQPHERCCVPRAWEWGSAPAEDVLGVTDEWLLAYQNVYPMHSLLELRPQSHDELALLKRDNDALKLAVSRIPVSSNKEVVCKLCGTSSLSLQAMRIHLFSQAHKAKEEDFRMLQS